MEHNDFAAFLNSLRSDEPAAEREDNEMFVSSIKDANTLLAQHMYPTSANAKYRRQLVDYITDPDNCVYGDPDVYHNFIMDLFRVGDFSAAIKVCDFVLSRAPKNMDMLADAIKACGDSCQFELGEKYLEKAMAIPKELWHWRLFLYGIDFLHTKLKAHPDNDNLYQRAYALSEEYIEKFPADEHGYNQQAELLVTRNKRDEAIKKLYTFITATNPLGLNGGELICAQCCVTFLNLMDDSSDYDKIIEICDKGMACTTQEQPSAAIGFFIYRKALALDAKACNDDFRVGTVLEALACYQTAYDLNQDRSYARTIEQRYALLRPHVKEFAPLVKRPLYIEEN